MSVAGQWNYEFEYRDHQNNLRVAFKADGNQLVQTQTQEQDPFGLEIKPLSSQNSVNSNQYKFLNRQDLPELNGVSDLVNRFYDKQIGRFWSIDPKVDDGQHSFTPYHYSFNNPIRFSDPDGLMGESCCGDGADGIGNGMTLVENIYWSTRDALVSSVATVSTFVGSIFSDVKLQRINATYSSGSRTLSAEVIPKSEVAQEVAMSTLALASAIPSGGSAGTGLLLAKTSTKTSAASSVVQEVKKLSKVERLKTVEPVGEKFIKKTEIRPGNGPGQSRAEIVSIKNKEGKTVKTYKDSYDRANTFQHRKPLRGGPEGRPQNEN